MHIDEVDKKAKAFSERLKGLRMQTGLSQKEFSHQVGINYTQYNKYEQGDTIPYTESLIRLADALKVSVDYLLEGKEEDAAIANFEDKDLLKIFGELEKMKLEDKDYIKKVVFDLIEVKKHRQLSTQQAS